MEFVKNLFYNAEETRLRTLVRIPIFFFFFILLFFLGRLAITPLQENFLYYRLIQSPLNFGLVILLFWIMAKLFDRRKVADYGFSLNKQWVKDLMFGLFLGFFLITFVFVLELLMGWVVIKDYYYVTENRNFTLTMLESLLLYIFVGYYEEATSRGYLLKNIAEGMNFKKTGPVFAVIFALLFTSLLFGFGHADNPNATFIGWWNIIIVGSLFAYSFVITNSLAIPIGIHITWNFFQGSVYGFPVSGNPTRVSFLNIEQHGSAIWTGGDFGPEAGLVIYFVAVFWLILLHIWLKYIRTTKEEISSFAVYKSELAP